MGVKPEYRVIANDSDITNVVRDRLRSLRVTDVAGTVSDTVEIILADHDPERPIAVPPTGAELDISLGYDGKVRRMGLFIVDEIELSGPPNSLVIRARAAPYEASKGGKSDLQTQKSRSWKKGTKIGAMVRKMAGEHGLKASVSDGLASIALPHTDQSHESDMNLLNRLAKRYDAIAKPAGGYLMFVKRGESKTASGAAMDGFTVNAEDASSWRAVLAKRDGAGTVVARYRDVGKAKTIEVAVGEGDPVRQLRMAYRDQASAVQAARAEQRKRARTERTVTVEMPGNEKVVAETTMTLVGFRDGVDGDWLVNRVEHYIGPEGFTSRVEAEKPNSDSDVSKADTNVVERDQSSTEEGE